MSNSSQVNPCLPILVSGRWIKIASIFDEDLVEGDSVVDPIDFVKRIKLEHPEADIASFTQKLPDVSPKWQFQMEWEDFAAIPITSYQDWWEGLSWKRRRDVRRAEKRGVTVKPAILDESFLKGIKRIYDEVPLRQGKPFWHYQKELALIHKENSTYQERSQCIGAYLGSELIGFIRMVYVAKTATILQIVSMVKHTDKCPTNALIARAVELAADKGVTHLIYARYDCNPALMDFKRHNGFQRFLCPRYYIPLSIKGSLALKFNLHKGVKEILPKNILSFSLKTRRIIYERIIYSQHRPAIKREDFVNSLPDGN